MQWKDKNDNDMFVQHVSCLFRNLCEECDGKNGKESRNDQNLKFWNLSRQAGLTEAYTKKNRRKLSLVVVLGFDLLAKPIDR